MLVKMKNTSPQERCNVGFLSSLEHHNVQFQLCDVDLNFFYQSLERLDVALFLRQYWSFDFLHFVIYTLILSQHSCRFLHSRSPTSFPSVSKCPRGPRTIVHHALLNPLHSLRPIPAPSIFFNYKHSRYPSSSWALLHPCFLLERRNSGYIEALEDSICLENLVQSITWQVFDQLSEWYFRS